MNIFNKVSRLNDKILILLTKVKSDLEKRYFLSMELLNIKKPSLAFIKLVEAVGILLEVPKQSEKSKFKAPIPTNYDNTIQVLSSEFYVIVNRLSKLASQDITNEIASELYEKFLEPEFCYDTAIRDGGLLARELLNVVILILFKIQNDHSKLPVHKHNIFVLVNGSRCSYIALDTATHVFNHGLCSIGAVHIESTNNPKTRLLSQYLSKDIFRRCKSLYKLPDNHFRIVDFVARDENELVESIKTEIESEKISILVIGIDDCNFDEDSYGGLKSYGAWETPFPVIFVKPQSRVRPFTSVHSPRSVLLCIKSNDDLSTIFAATLICLRPGDHVTILLISEDRNPQGSWRDTRYGGGIDAGWVNGVSSGRTKDFPGWNDKYLEETQQILENFLRRAQVAGKIRLETVSKEQSVGQHICKIAQEESVDYLVLKFRNRRELIVQVLKESSCSVIILK